MSVEVYSTGRANLPGAKREVDLLGGFAELLPELLRYSNSNTDGQDEEAKEGEFQTARVPWCPTVMKPRGAKHRQTTVMLEAVDCAPNTSEQVSEQVSEHDAATTNTILKAALGSTVSNANALEWGSDLRAWMNWGT